MMLQRFKFQDCKRTPENVNVLLNVLHRRACLINNRENIENFNIALVLPEKVI